MIFFQVADICFRPESDSRFDRDTCAAMVAKVGPHLSVVVDKVVMDQVVIGELVMELNNDQGSIWRSGGRSWRGGCRGRVGRWTFKNLQSSDSFL